MDYQDFNARINIKSFLTESFSTGAKFSIETFLEETKLVVMEKFEIEYRHKPKFFKKTAILGSARILIQKTS